MRTVEPNSLLHNDSIMSLAEWEARGWRDDADNDAITTEWSKWHGPNGNAANGIGFCGGVMAMSNNSSKLFCRHSKMLAARIHDFILYDPLPPPIGIFNNRSVSFMQFKSICITMSSRPSGACQNISVEPHAHTHPESKQRCLRTSQCKAGEPVIPWRMIPGHAQGGSRYATAKKAWHWSGGHVELLADH